MIHVHVRVHFFTQLSHTVSLRLSIFNTYPSIPLYYSLVEMVTVTDVPTVRAIDTVAVHLQILTMIGGTEIVVIAGDVIGIARDLIVARLLQTVIVTVILAVGAVAIVGLVRDLVIDMTIEGVEIVVIGIEIGIGIDTIEEGLVVRDLGLLPLDIAAGETGIVVGQEAVLPREGLMHLTCSSRNIKLHMQMDCWCRCSNSNRANFQTCLCHRRLHHLLEL